MATRYGVLATLVAAPAVKPVFVLEIVAPTVLALRATVGLPLVVLIAAAVQIPVLCAERAAALTIAAIKP